MHTHTLARSASQSIWSFNPLVSIVLVIITGCFRASRHAYGPLFKSRNALQGRHRLSSMGWEECRHKGRSAFRNWLKGKELFSCVNKTSGLVKVCCSLRHYCTKLLLTWRFFSKCDQKITFWLNAYIMYSILAVANFHSSHWGKWVSPKRPWWSRFKNQFISFEGICVSRSTGSSCYACRDFLCGIVAECYKKVPYWNEMLPLHLCRDKCYFSRRCSSFVLLCDCCSLALIPSWCQFVCSWFSVYSHFIATSIQLCSACVDCADNTAMFYELLLIS